jgi:signal transduction histidine kinase
MATPSHKRKHSLQAVEPNNHAEQGVKEIHFRVDAALFRELGERLVGRPHIALAELVKNSYDADAFKVIIRFAEDRIEVSDNGHGMNLTEFRNFWMRIGSPHKQVQRVSRKLKRPMTGSKGVGRLAVQFLASRIEVRTVSEKKTGLELKATVNWDEAIKAGELTEAVALYQEIPRTTEFPDNSSHGIKIILSRLNQNWNSDDFKNLAREIWWLQPPFQNNPELSSEEQKSFTVDLVSPESDVVQEFDVQMRAYLDIWHARLFGKLVSDSKGDANSPPIVRLSLEFSDGTKTTWKYQAPNSSLHAAQFEIRIFHLMRRQKHGISVGMAREYLYEHGGVHVYDAGFHLPYYGPENDWLDIEIDHSHRLNRSKLLPDSLQVPRGMNFLPTQSRLLGVVHVDTAQERDRAKGHSHRKESEYLKIQVSRDRLVDNVAYQNLKNIVRIALDYYAMQEAKRAFKEAEALRKIEPVREKFQRVDQVLSQYKKQIPQPIFEELREHVEEAIDASEAESKAITQQVGLLGSLATAGMSALAYEHEVVKQLILLEEVAEELTEIQVRDGVTRQRLKSVASNLSEWIERARATRSLFSSLMDEENRTARSRFKARMLVDEVNTQMTVLTRGVDIDTTEIDDSLRLPEGGFAEWSAVFQNVFLNAINAMLDAKVRRISASSRTRGRTRIILIQDTGSGVDLASAEDLFKPFVRKSKLSPERRALGLGGTGLGLAIVKMIAGNLDCKVAFVEPEDSFKTAFQLSWNELK